MARLPRLIVAGLPHHVIQRGNNRQAIFFDDADRERYLVLLNESARRLDLPIHAYVLMPNHVHVLTTPPAATSLSAMMQSIGRSYVRWINRRCHRSGTLFEGRFRSTVVDADRYLLTCARYIELNPVRAELVAEPAAFRWSSHRHNVGLESNPIVTEHLAFWQLGNTPFERQGEYRRMFESPISSGELDAIRQSTNSGFVLGEVPFLAEVQAATPRRASPARPGRPSKERT